MSIAINSTSSQSDPLSLSTNYATSPAAQMLCLFESIDSEGNGSITQDQFNQAFPNVNAPTVLQNSDPSSIFNQLDPNGTGSVSQDDFVSTMTALMKSLRNGDAQGSPASAVSALISSNDPLLADTQSLTDTGTSDPLLDNGLGGSVNLIA